MTTHGGAGSDHATFDAFLVGAGLMASGEVARYTPLTGGVSSDIHRVDLPGRTLCIKRALPKLKVAADWHAPVSRATFEWRWIRFAAGIVPRAVPRPLAQDPRTGLFAMAFLDPADHPVWKTQLLRGEVDPRTAGEVGRIVGRIHAASTRADGTAEAFASDENFFALRLDPYLNAAAAAHPVLAPRLHDLVRQTAATKRALVHGDVSPKNILVGPDGPVLLDAECAWFGDPAFDLAFCLNHLLLKALVVPARRHDLAQAFDRLCEAYRREVDWEPAADVEARAAALLPALFLARVDGKSPVEYVTQESQREAVRAFAAPLLLSPVASPAAIARGWFTP